jgi:hypothetical protein
MFTAWVGSRRVAFIPARPTNLTPPADWTDRMRQRILYDPDPAGGEDCSLRAYYHAISYGKAQLQADVFSEVSVQPSHCGAMQDEAIKTLPPGHSYEYACVVFPAGTLGGACAGWAFYGGGPFPGTSNLHGWCYVDMDAPLGTWAMELLHILTSFGDLYNPINPATPPPGDFDEMACACGTHPSAFTKLHLGWLDPAYVSTVVGRGQASFTMHALALLPPPPAGRVVAVRIPSVVDPTHYFLVECRLKADRFERATPGFSSGIPSEGVVVYEIDEITSPLKVWLRTTTALSAGQKYANQAEGLEIEATSAVWGGFSVAITSLEPPECDGLRAEKAQAEGEIATLQEDLEQAAPGEKAGIIRQIRTWEATLRAAEQRARELGCAM